MGTKIADRQEDQPSVEVRDQVDGKGNESNVRYINDKSGGNVSPQLNKESMVEGKDRKKKASISGQDITSFDSKECESVENASCPKNEEASVDSQINEASSQTGNVAQLSLESLPSSKDCWLCAWNVPNETSLALLIIIVACLALALKVVLTSNGYMFVVLMTVVVCFTYYHVSRSFEQ